MRRRSAGGTAPERVDEQIGAIRGAAYDPNYKVSNIPPLEAIRAGIEAHPLWVCPERSSSRTQRTDLVARVGHPVDGRSVDRDSFGSLLARRERLDRPAVEPHSAEDRILGDRKVRRAGRDGDPTRGSLPTR